MKRKKVSPQKNVGSAVKFFKCPPGQTISFLWGRCSNAERGSEDIFTKKYHTHAREKGGLSWEMTFTN